MAGAPKYFKAVKGITDGMVHHAKDEVFAATESIAAHFERTGGKNGDEVLYEPISDKEFASASVEPVGDALINEDGSVALGAGAPSATDVVGGGVYADPSANADEPVVAEPEVPAESVPADAAPAE